ncbi:NUDIX hydrolase [Pseudonocardia spinosispora]|uniref:NUDIX hydrolase n=1 Tax=Pseudonocardia spinosispora TaxID=103441 RepID=UPI000424770F|nr:NUDIX hydrolase [Pseudonocardia spinosispora]
MTEHHEIDIVAAGAALWRPTPDGQGHELALVHRPRYDDWSLPKGKLEHGESEPVAAIREIAEETGFAARLGARLGETRYRVPQGNKIVYYWYARAGEGEFSPNDEVDELRWVSPEAAGALLSYDFDRGLVERFRAVPPPEPLLLVRHAKAGNRHNWDGDDDLRPLTGKGRVQAEELLDLLESFGPVRAYSAPPIRCGQTIQPFADRHRLPVRIEPLMGEEGYWDAPDDGVTRLLELADGADVPVICSQGGVIPDLVERLTDHVDPPSRKASTWVLGVTGGKVVTADYYEPPGADTDAD